MTSPGLLPIGAFARMARLSVKALRHYDAQGLLTPARVDPATGYRYYAVTQVRAAATIALLRSLDVPLPLVRDVLTAPDDATRGVLMAAEQQRLAAELERRRRALDTINRLAGEPAAVPYAVTVGPRSAQRLLALLSTTRLDAIDTATTAACQRLAHLLGPGAARRGPFVSVYPLDLDDTIDIAVGVPSSESAGGAASDPSASVLERVDLPGGQWASTVHVGAYAALPLAYTALLERVRELGHQAAGPVCETYLTDPTTSAEPELVTALAVALAPGEEDWTGDEAVMHT